jgi:hypothetical protein
MEPLLSFPERLLAILGELQALEPIFHSAHADATPEQLEQYVSPQFWEVGASGNRYSRDFALDVLKNRQALSEEIHWRATDWCIAEAGENNYLLTYTLIQSSRVTRRLSVWRLSPTGWQVIYHQGTLVQGASDCGSA